MSLDQMRREASDAAKKNNDPSFSVEDIANALGNDADEFLKCMTIVEAIIADPRPYMGLRAATEALKLSALRTRIGSLGQMYKSAAVGNPELRKRKDILLTMYDALTENVNCLKVCAKYGQEIM